MTDEYFNNLATYKDTVQNFFAEHNGYLPMNSDCYACVFLMLKNETRTKLHAHQYKSAEIQDENNKKGNEVARPENEDEEENEQGNEANSNKPKKIKIEKI